MSELHQLVFGYDDGHRLLAGSTKLLADTQALLLSTTDADPGDDLTYIVTGLPLPAEKLYALCFTWRAPELPRPGSVWAHVLLFSAAQLRDFKSPYNYAVYARRPSRGNLMTYQHPVTATPETSYSFKYESLLKISDLVLRHSSGTIRDLELHDAADAFGFIWGLQWPALRSRFRFRTRHVARVAAGRQVYQVARKVEGALSTTSPTAAGDTTRHSTVTTTWQLLDHETSVRAFMFEFGPKSPANSATFTALYDIYWAQQKRDARRCCLLIERAFPEATQAADLKMSLLGAKADLFAEDAVVQCLLASSVDAWDLEALMFQRRLQKYLRTRGLTECLERLASPAAPTVADAVARALRTGCTLRDLVWVLEHRADIFERAIAGAMPTLRSAENWRELSTQRATRLMQAVPLTSAVAAAAVGGRQIDALIAAHGYPRLLNLSSQAEDSDLASLLLEAAPPSAQEVSSWDAEALIFAVACQPGLLTIDSVATRLESALEWRREQPNSTWLQAASALLAAGGPVADHSLTTSFGPLHQALTENRLPREAWRTIDSMLPPGKDTSYRLRDHLLNVAQYRDWSTHDLSSALRDAGPFTRAQFWPKRGAGDRTAKQLRVVLENLGMASK